MPIFCGNIAMSEEKKMGKLIPTHLIDKNGTIREAKNAFDFLVTKLGLAPLVDLIKMLIQTLLSMVVDYESLDFVKKKLDQLINKLVLFKDYGLF